MGDDEMFLLFVAMVGSVSCLIWWVKFWRSGDPFRSGYAVKILPTLALLAGLLTIWQVLRRWADDEVRDHAGYLFLLMGWGLIWQMLSTVGIAPWFGLSVREDAVGAKNRAASVGLAGVILGNSLCYAGANVGEGPSLWNNLFSALLASVGLFLGWGIVQSGGRISDSIAEERDLSAGMRLAGFLVAAGLVLGRAVAGDWVSSAETMKDCIKFGWPVLLLALAAGVIERAFRPSRERPFPEWKIYGLLTAIFYMGGAIFYLLWLRPWTRK